MDIQKIAAAALCITLGACSNYADLPKSQASYTDVQNEVGCHSSYGEDKQNHLWETQYKDHWMTWSGTIEDVPEGGLTINVDGVGTSDLAVQFENKQEVFDLKAGDQVSVAFVMTGRGGCVLDFEGEHAKLVNS